MKHKKHNKIVLKHLLRFQKKKEKKKNEEIKAKQIFV